MSRKTRKRSLSKPRPTPSLTQAILPATPDNYSITTSSTPLLPGRQTQPSNVNPLGNVQYSFLARRQYQEINLDFNSNYNAFQSNPFQMLDLFADISPEVSLALWNKVLLVNGTYHYSVRNRTGTKELQGAKAVLQEIVQGINATSGGIDALIDSMTITAFLQGAVAAEIILTPTLDDIVDIVTVQPWTIHFSRDAQQNLVPYQEQHVIANAPITGSAGFPYKRLNPVTFAYIPLHAQPDDPYGRAPAAPVLQLIAFDLQLLKDIRQWVHVSAWGRMDIKILEEKVRNAAPPRIRNNPDPNVMIRFVNDKMAEFQTAFENMQSDDALIHSDSIEITGLDTAGQTFRIADVVSLLTEKLVRALKELPVLMAVGAGGSQAHSTVQWSIYSANIEAFQKLIANVLSRLLTVALQVRGIQGQVEWVFDSVRVTDRLQDANALSVEIANEARKRDEGWQTQDEASIKITGSLSVADPPPLPIPGVAPAKVEPPKQDGNDGPTPKAPESKDSTTSDTKKSNSNSTAA